MSKGTGSADVILDFANEGHAQGKVCRTRTGRDSLLR